MSRASTLVHLLGQAVRHPGLLPLLGRAAWRFRRRDWFRRPPFIPVPSPDYLAWRMHTAFGDEADAPPAELLEGYLRWTRRMTRDS